MENSKVSCPLVAEEGGRGVTKGSVNEFYLEGNDLRGMCTVGMVFEYAVPDAECNTATGWNEVSLDRVSVAKEK